MTAPAPGAMLTSPEAVAAFIFGGKARFTLKSRKTGKHLSFRVKVAKDGGAYFVSAAKAGDEDQGGFNYAGFLKPGDKAVRTSKKSNATLAPARAALDWTLRHVLDGDLPSTLEVWHEGRCCRCSRKLTDPDSIILGIGPECRKKVKD